MDKITIKSEIKQEPKELPELLTSSVFKQLQDEAPGVLHLPVSPAGKQKKVYRPNLVSRRKHNLEETMVISRPSKPVITRQRQKPTRNLIQTEGLFSQGIGKKVGVARAKGFSGSEPSAKWAEKPEYIAPNSYNALEEQQLLSDLKSCSFIDDGARNDAVLTKYPVDCVVKKEPNTSGPQRFFSGEEGLFVMQLPDLLPGFGEDPNTTKYGRCLEEFSDGRIGKLVRYKSGRVHLKIGDYAFDVIESVKKSFNEEMVCVTADEARRAGEMVHLGPVSAHFVVAPDFENLLEKSDK